MTVTDRFIANAESYASRWPASRPVLSSPTRTKVRGFVYEVEKGTLREVL